MLLPGLREGVQMRNATLITIRLREPGLFHFDVMVHFFENAELIQTLTLKKIDGQHLNDLRNFLQRWSSGHVADMQCE